jgi:hypothetical protein
MTSKAIIDMVHKMKVYVRIEAGLPAVMIVLMELRTK